MNLFTKQKQTHRHRKQRGKDKGERTKFRTNTYTLLYIEQITGVSIVAQQKRIQPETMRLPVKSLASLSGLRIQRCRELQCRLKTQLSFGVAVAVVQAGSCSSNQTPSLGSSICHGCGPKKQTKPNQNKTKTTQQITNKDLLCSTGSYTQHLVIKKKKSPKFPWSSRLRIQHCHSCGTGSTPDLRTFVCRRHGQKKRKKKDLRSIT